MKHKTQVFVHHEGDHYRTRLTHTLEVAQIARSLARPLGLDEDLTEALALSHDLGHPPFGHAGERALNTALQDFGGFDHNAQSLRAVTQLERRYPLFDGLNLTWETLEGLVKHNGPLLERAGSQTKPEADRLPYAIQVYQGRQDLELDRFASLEAQIAAISDDVAYDNHDIEDGLRAGLISLSDLKEIALTRRIIDQIERDYPDLDASRTQFELIRRCITCMIEDITAQTFQNLDDMRIESNSDVHLAGCPLATFSTRLAQEEKELKAFLFHRIYRSQRVMGPVIAAEAMVRRLFAAYFEQPDNLPTAWRDEALSRDVFGRARRVADYVAGMTDRYALSEFKRLFDEVPELG